MKRCVALSVILGAVLLFVAGPASSAVDEYSEQQKAGAAVSKEGQVEEKVPWRNSIFSYGHALSALSLSKGAELRHDPYYSQSLSFKPRYYLRDDLSIRMRLDLEIELTTSNSTDRAREWVVSDLSFDINYAPSWMIIPVAEIMVNPSLRFTFPTSKVSRGHSLMMGIAPGVTFRRAFKLLDGSFLKNIGVFYGFRAGAYLHEYATGQISGEVCKVVTDSSSPNDPGCQQTGGRNRSWRFTNALGFQLSIMDKLTASASIMFIYDTLYKDDSKDVSFDGTPTISLDETNINHRASTWFILGVSYDVFDWLGLTLGVSTYHPQLADNSELRTPFFNRYTAFFLDVDIPVDKFVNQVQTWTGWGN